MARDLTRQTAGRRNGETASPFRTTGVVDPRAVERRPAHARIWTNTNGYTETVTDDIEPGGRAEEVLHRTGIPRVGPAVPEVEPHEVEHEFAVDLHERRAVRRIVHAERDIAVVLEGGEAVAPLWEAISVSRHLTGYRSCKAKTPPFTVVAESNLLRTNQAVELSESQDRGEFRCDGTV